MSGARAGDGQGTTLAEADEHAARGAPALPVTLVAHHVGRVGGMERQLSELALGLRRNGHEVTVIAHECTLAPESGVVFRRVPGPSRPFLLGYPWFLIFGSLAVRRWRRGAVQATGAIVLNHVDVVAVHYCHQVGVVDPQPHEPALPRGGQSDGSDEPGRRAAVLPDQPQRNVRVRVRGRCR